MQILKILQFSGLIAFLRNLPFSEFVCTLARIFSELVLNFFFWKKLLCLKIFRTGSQNWFSDITNFFRHKHIAIKVRKANARVVIGSLKFLQKKSDITNFPEKQFWEAIFRIGSLKFVRICLYSCMLILNIVFGPLNWEISQNSFDCFPIFLHVP